MMGLQTYILLNFFRSFLRVSENLNFGDSALLHFHISSSHWSTWWLILASIILFGLLVFLFIRFRLRTAERERNLIVLKLKAEQRALKAKMNPHFIFNVISSLQYLISDNQPEKSSIFLEHFSMLIRRMLDQSDTEYISIKKEVEFVTGYIELEKLRFEDKFEYQIEISENCDTSLLIPNLLIQPIVENCIQHGLKNKEGKGLLSISLSCKNSLLTVSIEDDGVGYNRTIKSVSNKNKGYKSKGLETIISRLLIHNRDPGIKGFEIFDLFEKEGRTGAKAIVNIKTKKNEGDNN